MEGFAKLAGHLQKLVADIASSRSKRGSAWTHECEDSFEALKAKLVLAPVLAYAHFKRPFILEIDGSYSGLGAVLGRRPMMVSGPWPTQAEGFDPRKETWKTIAQ